MTHKSSSPRALVLIDLAQFHSDSERGLGPLVAGLSLGAPALMHFRIHHKYRQVVDPRFRKIAMTLVLRHVRSSSVHVELNINDEDKGDILVMDGADVQEYYE